MVGEPYIPDEATPVTAAGELRQQAQLLVEKLHTMQEAEEAFERAKQAYDDYSKRVLPDLFKFNGIQSIMTGDLLVSVETKTSCSINKNEADKQNVAAWLREHDGENLVKQELIVPESQKEKLEAMNVTFKEDLSMNTNSVKAFLLDQLGQKGGPAVIQKTDIPKGINFYQWDEMSVTASN